MQGRGGKNGARVSHTRSGFYGIGGSQQFADSVFPPASTVSVSSRQENDSSVAPGTQYIALEPPQKKSGFNFNCCPGLWNNPSKLTKQAAPKPVAASASRAREYNPFSK